VAPDTYRFTEAWGEPAAGERWTLKSSVLNGRDVWDTPLRLTPGEPAEWTLVYTDTPSVLEGSLRDGSGGAVTDASVLVFPADRAYWIAGSRRIRMARPATDATYRVRGLPAGDYFVAAFTDLEPGEWNDPTVLAQASQDALRITLRNGATTRQDLTIQR
jgi:hypothetical protein